MIILIILIIVLLLSLSLINKTFKKKDNILEDVKLQENTIRNDGFALMLQQSDGTYKESESNLWPTDMKFNSELSGCIDTNGSKIENSLSFDSTTNFITLKTNKTSYCYVYFDIDNSATSYLIKNVSSEELWNSPLEDDGYRYVGTNPSNYICFGTSDKDTCVNDTDKYMYRIIGIFEDENENQHIKLIKKEALNSQFKWFWSYNSDVDWNKSDAYSKINGSEFLENTSYPYMQDTSWTDKITTWNYTMTNTKTYESDGPDYLFMTGKSVYLHELNRAGKSNESCPRYTGTLVDCDVGEWKILNTKVSLMYASDYLLSLGSDALSYISAKDNKTIKTGWIHITNNDANPLSSTEWTMTRAGLVPSTGTSYAYYAELGVIEANSQAGIYAVRPVFYLESDVELSRGTGTTTDPYIIQE